MKKIINILPILAFMAIGKVSFSQIQLSMQPLNTSSRFSDILTINIVSALQEHPLVQLEYTIQKDSQEVFKGTTNTISVNNGTQQLSSYQLSFTKYSLLDDETAEVFKSNKLLQQGNYQLCIRVVQTDNFITHFSDCWQFNIVRDYHSKAKDSLLQSQEVGVDVNSPQLNKPNIANGSAGIEGGPNKPSTNNNKTFIFNGNTQVIGQTSNVAIPYSGVPKDYVSTQTNFTMGAFGIPLNGNLVYTSMQSNVQYQINSIQLGFDSYRFKQDLWKNIQAKQLQQQLDLDLKLKHRNNLQLKMDSLNGGIDNDQYEYNKKLLKGYQDLSLADSMRAINYQAEIERLEKELRETDSLRGQLSFYQDSLAKFDKLNKLAAISERLRRQKKQLLNQPDDLSAQLKEYDLDNPLNKFLLSIRTFDLGLSFPNYSPLMLNGIGINGVNIELEPENKYYVAFAYGNTVNSFNTIKKKGDGINIMAGKVGLGTLDKSHFHVGFLRGKLNHQPDSFTAFYKTNWVWDAEAKLAITDYTSLQGNVAISRVYDPLNASENKTIGNPSVLLEDKNNLSWILRFNTTAKKTKTNLSAFSRIVQPGFISYGSPYLRSDNYENEVRVNQPIGKKVNLTGFYRRNKDNLKNTKEYTTTLNSIGASLNARYNSHLFSVLTYNPFKQKSTSKETGQVINTTNQSLSATLGYNKNNKGRNYSLIGTYTHFRFNSLIEQNTQNMYMLSNFINLKIPLSINNTVTYSQMDKPVSSILPQNELDSLRKSFIHYESSVTYNLKNRYIPEVGYNHFNDFNREHFTGIYTGCFFNIIKNLSSELRLERRFYNYKDQPNLPAKQTIGTIKLMYNW